MAHYRIGVSTQSTLRGAKNFNNAPTITSFTHTEIPQWEKNEGNLTSNFEVNSQQKNSNKIWWGAHCTEACKLFRLKFQMFCNAFSMRPTAKCFYWSKSRICRLVFYQLYILLFACLACTRCLHIWGGTGITRKYRNSEASKHTEGFRCYAKAILIRRVHRNNAPTKVGTGQHFCSPARPELTRNRPARNIQ